MDSTEISYSIKLPAFEGPLDLLLHLIRENKIDIYDIPIALITHQYLEYLEIMKELNLDIAGEFLVMAATLIHIKSRMLLPVDEDVPEEEREDPRFELVQRLLEYQTFKEASLALREREMEWSNVFARTYEIEDVDMEASGELNLFDLSLFDLIAAFKRILEKTPQEEITITRETLTVKDRVTHILEMVEKTEAIRFEELFDGNRSRPRLIVTFIALLEVLRLGLVRVFQERDFGTIWIINPRCERTS
ncbi:MAG: segregation and condensation protein A, partial [Thermodesulfovibrionales bacterium]